MELLATVDWLMQRDRIESTVAMSVAALAASQTGPLGQRGTIPGQDDFRLLITDTIPGSFGFRLGEVPPEGATHLPEESPLDFAIVQAKTILEASVSTDDRLAAALSGTDVVTQQKPAHPLRRRNTHERTNARPHQTVDREAENRACL